MLARLLSDAKQQTLSYNVEYSETFISSFVRSFSCRPLSCATEHNGTHDKASHQFIQSQCKNGIEMLSLI